MSLHFSAVLPSSYLSIHTDCDIQFKVPFKNHLQKGLSAKTTVMAKLCSNVGDCSRFIFQGTCFTHLIYFGV